MIQRMRTALHRLQGIVLQRDPLRGRELRHDERGDVPGWVLVTIMTAGMVIAIWALAGPALEELFTQAFDRVRSF